MWWMKYLIAMASNIIHNEWREIDMLQNMVPLGTMVKSSEKQVCSLQIWVKYDAVDGNIN